MTTYKKGYCPNCNARVHDPLPKDQNFFCYCYDCGHAAFEADRRAVARLEKEESKEV